MTPPLFSVVVPVYGCAPCLEHLCDRLVKTLTTITPRFEIILVDDRSPDGAWEKIVDLQQRLDCIRGLRLSRNFGQHMAIAAGLGQAKGEFTVVMDCDLQDPPELIPALYAKLREGHDLVLAKRIERSHSNFRVWMANLYFFVLRILTEEKIDGRYGSFSILSRKVVDAYLRFNEREQHYLFVIRWSGFRAGTLDYEHQKREVGKSSYSLWRLLSHAADGVFFQSTVFLRWIVVFGLLMAACGLALSAYFVFRYFTHGSLAGWTSVVVLLLVNTGIILTCLGVVGLYVGKIFDQSKGRPLYVVDEIREKTKS